MKSEHRHELAQNDLEMLISKLRARYAYIVETHGNRILLWASVAFLAVAAAVYWAKSSNSTNADGWSALAGARSPEDLAGIAEAYAGTPVGNWAAPTSAIDPRAHTVIAAVDPTTATTG